MITIKIRTTVDVMLNSVVLIGNLGHMAKKFLMSGNAVLAKTYAKVYYKGAGWYAVSGYSADGSDVHKIINQINDLKRANAVLKEGGYYFDKKGKIVGMYNTPAESIDVARTELDNFVF
jgi:hypothetical protein